MSHVVYISDNQLGPRRDNYSGSFHSNQHDGQKEHGRRESEQSTDTEAGSLPQMMDRKDSYVLTRCQYAIYIFKGALVRLCLALGNLLAAWRAVIMLDDKWQWLLSAICLCLLMLEFLYVVFSRRGHEWKWWSPCFLVYLSTTVPLVWRIHLFQQEQYVRDLQAINDDILGGIVPQAVSPCNITSGNCSSTVTTTIQSVQMDQTKQTLTRLKDINWETFLELSDETWVICINESIIYLIIFARWFLPRGAVSREFLADLLLEYLAIASDIMELLALFDIGLIRGNRPLNIWILTVWTISFVQFLPMLMHKRKYKPVTSRHLACLSEKCGAHAIEIIITLMAICLQDGPFLIVRLYIIVDLDIITYSLTFFMLKNICTLLLLFYRLIILCRKATCIQK